MAEAGVSVKAGKNAKSQVGDRPLICNTSFLIIETQVAETLRLIQSNSTLPIQRARMRVRVIVPEAEGERLQEQLLALAEKVEKEDKGETWETVCVLIACFWIDLTELHRLCLLSPLGSVKSMSCCRRSARERGASRRLPLPRPLTNIKLSSGLIYVS